MSRGYMCFPWSRIYNKILISKQDHLRKKHLSTHLKANLQNKRPLNRQFAFQSPGLNSNPVLVRLPTLCSIQAMKLPSPDLAPILLMNLLGPGLAPILPIQLSGPDLAPILPMNLLGPDLAPILPMDLLVPGLAPIHPIKLSCPILPMSLLGPDLAPLRILLDNQVPVTFHVPGPDLERILMMYRCNGPIEIQNQTIIQIPNHTLPKIHARIPLPHLRHIWPFK
jgi:hypothetical protein